MVLFIQGCASTSTDSYMDSWLEKANLDADETKEELYEKAKSEGILNIYSVSTRVTDVAKSFENEYPGLVVNVQDIRGTEIINKLNENYDNLNFNCDLILRTDNDGMFSHELVPKGLAYKYVPNDISPKILDQYNKETLNLMGEVLQIFYNDEYYDQPPITNWWELTDKKWRGKVMMANINKSDTALAALCMIIKNDYLMEQAYLKHYGKPYENKEQNAGEFFIDKLIENDLIVANASDEVAEGVGAPGNSDSSMIGIMISSKIRLRDIGYNIMPIYKLEPFDGFYTPNSIMIAGGAKNINAAKLFIRWILGETDGQGNGYKTYLKNGCWSVRSDVKSDSPLSLGDMNLIYLDVDYIYENKEKVSAQWKALIDNRYNN